MLERIDPEQLANLEYEWKYLSVAVATWRWLDHQPDLLELTPLHADVMAMDSAFLHGRNLYEFFGKTTGRDGDQKIRSFTVRDLGVDDSHLPTPWLESWASALNARIFHFRESRSEVFDQAGTSQPRDIKDQVPHMAAELNDLWLLFLDLCPPHLQPSLLEVKQRAEQDITRDDLNKRFSRIATISS